MLDKHCACTLIVCSSDAWFPSCPVTSINSRLHWGTKQEFLVIKLFAWEILVGILLICYYVGFILKSISILNGLWSLCFLGPSVVVRPPGPKNSSSIVPSYVEQWNVTPQYVMQKNTTCCGEQHYVIWIAVSVIALPPPSPLQSHPSSFGHWACSGNSNTRLNAIQCAFRSSEWYTEIQIQDCSSSITIDQGWMWSVAMQRHQGDFRLQLTAPPWDIAVLYFSIYDHHSSPNSNGRDHLNGHLAPHPPSPTLPPPSTSGRQGLHQLLALFATPASSVDKDNTTARQ